MSEQQYFEQFSGYNPDDDDNEAFVIQSNEDMKRFISMIRRKWAREHGL